MIDVARASKSLTRTPMMPQGSFTNRHAGLADPPLDVRFRGRYWGQSGHALLHCICPLMTQSGHRGRNLIAFENWRRP